MSVGPRQRAGITLLAAAAVIGLALWWNAPSNKRVEFLVLCERLVLPMAVTLNLNEAATQIAEVTLFGFDGSVSHLAREDVTSAEPRTTHHVETVTFAQAPHQPPPYLKMVPSGALGTATLQLDPGVGLTVSGRVLRVESRKQGDARLVIQSDRAAFEGARYSIGEVAPGVGSLADFSLLATGRPPGLLATMQPMAPSGAEVRADIAFVETGDEIVLVDRDTAVPLAPSTVQLVGAVNPGLRLDGKGVSELVADQPLDLAFDVESGMIERLALVFDATEHGKQGLRVSGSVSATSVRQDDREILPTWIEETLATSSWERSIWFVVLGVAAFTLFKFVDHAIGVLLKWVMGG